ncbi:uncharacterized protein LOC126285284 [Schistocerca gregaria]|uniref:uncharacterized protein LOC126285284 n=1 Tax=Schistocerca gregaria TaxID=7010 RepID=UPI00211E3072|nr:uncharacterized protein LOC126285284 [Schistocerca gregaria]
MQFAVLLISVLWGAALAYPMKNKYDIANNNMKTAAKMTMEGMANNYMKPAARMNTEGVANNDMWPAVRISMEGIQRIHADYVDLGGTTMGGIQRIKADFLDLGDTTMGGIQRINADFLDLGDTTMGGIQRINADFLDLGDTTMGGIQRSNADYLELGGTTMGGAAAIKTKSTRGNGRPQGRRGQQNAQGSGLLQFPSGSDIVAPNGTTWKVGVQMEDMGSRMFSKIGHDQLRMQNET